MSVVRKHLSRAAISLAFILSFATIAHAVSMKGNPCDPVQFGAIGDGTRMNTVAIQKAIDCAAKTHGTVTFPSGTYLTGSLFLKSGVTLEVPEGVTLIGSQKLEDYPILPTRIAGIEMTWPAALINVRDQQNVTIDRKSTRLNSSHPSISRMPSSA